MENFNLLDGSDTLKASRDTINNNLLSVRSLSSGAAFPTDNLSVGMLCYRTDLKRLYQYQENGSWSADIAMNINGNANTANSAGTAATANRATVADSCTGNSATATTAETCTGNSATATKLKSAISINNVAFDGTKNINIPVGVKTVNGIEPSADGDVVVDTTALSEGLTRVENKIDEYADSVTYIDAFLIETWKSDDGMTWYRKYSDGFIEQGGAISCGTGYQSVTVTLPTAFTTTTYTAMSAAAHTSKIGDGIDLISGKSTTAFTTHTHYKGDTLPTWYACGY